MTAKDYPVGFPFKGQDGTYYGPSGSVGLYHLGDDLFTPTGTQFVVLGKLLGLTGATGTVGGPHVHIAKWRPGNVSGGYFVAKYNRSYFKPTPSVWSAKGIISEISTQNVGDAGKFVRWKAEDGYTYEAFHFSEVKVKVGDKIGEIVLEEQPPVFNARYYLTKNPDVNKKYSVGNAVQHWLSSGIKEGRVSAPNFAVKEYLGNYADLRKALGPTGYAAAVKHYYNSGINEGRSGRTLKPPASIDKASALKYINEHLQ